MRVFIFFLLLSSELLSSVFFKESCSHNIPNHFDQTFEEFGLQFIKRISSGLDYLKENSNEIIYFKWSNYDFRKIDVDEDFYTEVLYWFKDGITTIDEDNELINILMPGSEYTYWQSYYVRLYFIKDTQGAWKFYKYEDEA